jgi:dCMP deaminase
VAQTIALKSKDPNCQVGAVIVSSDRLILSTGFNGLARGVYDDEDLLKDIDEKLKWVCHAELNAIVNASRIGVALKDSTIFVTKFPCLTCCNAIVQAGIQRIYTHDEDYWSKDPNDREHTRKKPLLKQGGVRVDAPFHPDFNPSHPLKLITSDQLTNGHKAHSNSTRFKAAQKELVRFRTPATNHPRSHSRSNPVR